MKKSLIALGLALIAVLPAMSVAGADHGVSYYGSNYRGNWANQYGYGYSNGSGVGGTGGSGYVGPGAGVQTNPKYQTPIHDESCTGRYRTAAGVVFEAVHPKDVATAAFMWNDSDCKQFVVDIVGTIAAGSDYFHGTALAWSRNNGDGIWNDLPVSTVPLSPSDLLAKFTQHGALSVVGNVITFTKHSNVGGICYLLESNLSGLAGTWTLKVVNGRGVTGETCVRTVGTPVSAPVLVPAVQVPVTTTTAPADSPVTTTTTTVPVAASVSTTTTTQPVAASTTTTTAPPVTTTTTRPAPTPSGQKKHCTVTYRDGGTEWPVTYGESAGLTDSQQACEKYGQDSATDHGWTYVSAYYGY